MHRSFKLHHRRHTGKLIHHRHTSYLALVIVLVSAGLCMMLTDSQAHAADIAVTATVPAPIPTGAPVFTLPVNNTVVDNPAVHFEGICPVIDPAVIIALYEGGNLLGSASCQTDGTFAVDASLTEGIHSIVAAVVTITGDNGKSSDPLNITYTPPSPPVVPSPGTPSTPPITSKQTRPTISSLIKPLRIISNSQFIAYGKRSMAVWKGSFTEGNAPYKVTINWGDGQQQTYTVTDHEPQTYLHAYKEDRNYDATITATDRDGRTQTIHIAVVSLTQVARKADTGSLVTGNGSASNGRILTVVYLSLTVSVLWLWRFEFLQHRKVVGVPVHYGWQKARAAKPNRQRHT
jgi:hypothetical protein